jgi:hypothetical protein
LRIRHPRKKNFKYASLRPPITTNRLLRRGHTRNRPSSTEVLPELRRLDSWGVRDQEKTETNSRRKEDASVETAYGFVWNIIIRDSRGKKEVE